MKSVYFLNCTEPEKYGENMEKVFYIDLRSIATKEELHELLAKELPLPDYYGRNLDALYDILTECGEGWNLIFYNVSSVDQQLSDYIGRLKKMAEHASKETDGLKIRFFQ